MNTLELTSVLNSDRFVSKIAAHVCAADQLPIKSCYPSAYIVNTDTRNKPGTHWVGMYIDKHGHCEYFDSYGLKPWQKNHREFLARCCKRYTYNQLEMQAYDSTVCGQYCAVFIACMSRGYSMNKFQNLFSDINNPKLNDLLITRKFRQLFGNNRCECYFCDVRQCCWPRRKHP